MKLDPQPAATSPTAFLTSPWSRRLGWALASLALLWLLGWLAVPPLLKSQFQSRLSETLGRQVTLGEVDFKPWSLELNLRDVAIGRAPGVTPASQTTTAPGPGTSSESGPQFTLKRLYIDMALQSLLSLAPVVDALVLESPYLRLTHTTPGHYDVDDLMARFASQSEAPTSSPLRFALYNLVLSDGQIELTDGPQQQVHRLSQLQLGLPFLSNLDSQREVLVQPRLTFDLNGSRFDSSTTTTPFAPGRKTEVQLEVRQLDLAPYLGYLPAGLPVKLKSGVIDADLKLAFEQAAKTTVSLSGQLTASRVQIDSAQAKAGPAAAELLAFERLNVELKDVQPLLQQVKLGQISWAGPQLTVQRNRAGQINLLALASPTGAGAQSPKGGASQPAKSAAATTVQPGTAAASAASASSLATPATLTWQVAADSFQIQGGDIHWLDQLPVQPARINLSQLKLQTGALAWPLHQSADFDGSAQLGASALQFKGSATDQAAQIKLQLAALPLSLARPYLTDWLMPQLEGSLNADLGLNWAAASGQQAGRTSLQVHSLSLDSLALRQGKAAPLASIGQVQLSEVAVDLGQQTARVGALRVRKPQAGISRNADGRWMFQEWLKNPAAPAAAAATRETPVIGQAPAIGQASAVGQTPPARQASDAAQATATRKAPANKSVAAAAPAWRLQLKEFELTDGAFSFVDKTTARPVRLEVSGAQVQLKNFSSPGKSPFDWRLSAKLRHGNTEPGKLAWRGSSALSPLLVKGELTAERLPLHAFAPYLQDSLNLRLLRADGSFKGGVNLSQQPAGMVAQVNGDARLEDLQARTLGQAEPFIAAEELLDWKSLTLTGLNLAMAPGVAPQVEVQGTVLSDFYARLILDQEGRLNLQDLLKPGVPAASPDPAAAAETADAAATAAEAKPGRPHAAVPAAPVIRFGPVSLVGGHINFTDRFIKPNYSADLTELVGKLSAFSSQTAAGEVQLADLELRGRAEGSATLEVLGKINPLVSPVALDIKGMVRELELAPLSTYSARYAGYGIERGKLSVDVAYKIQPDGQLTASNKLVLNQLKFGDAVPGATRSLPVKLAVALLADRNGVIDLDLPVSGSLNDPEFRLLPIVFKIIGNLIVKAITSPFTLLANAFGGGSGGGELSMVSFEPGSAVLGESARASLDKVAQALQDRPALKLTVVGSASLEVERDDYKRLQLQALVQAEKRRTEASASPDPAASSSNISAVEYPALLKKVYRRGNFPKPRNLVGLTKDLPVAEMEALLLVHLDASEAAMQALALRRGVVVRDYLASLKLPPERLFLGAAKTAAEPKWQPRAELNLALD